MTKNITTALVLLMFCGSFCRIRADDPIPVECWLDLSSDRRLLSYGKPTSHSLKQTCLNLSLFQSLKPLLGELKYTPIEISVPNQKIFTSCFRDKELSNLPDWDPNHIFGILSIIAKVIIDHGEKIKNCVLNPKKVYISTTESEITITFYPQNSESLSVGIWDTSGEPRKPFAYLMFYMVLPETRLWFERNALFISGENLFKLDKARPALPFQTYNWRDLTNNAEFFSPFKACALGLFYKKITMEDIVVYLDNWRVFNWFYNVIKASVSNFYYRTRKRERKKFTDLKESDHDKYIEILPLIRKVGQKWFNPSMLLWWLEVSPTENPSDYEAKFRELFYSEGLARKKFIKAVNFLWNICTPVDKTASLSIQIIPQTHQRLRRLWILTNEIQHNLSVEGLKP